MTGTVSTDEHAMVSPPIEGSVLVSASLNAALHDAFERDPEVLLLGQDVRDPYGGAFKITRGLSERWPDRVLSTPISEASTMGLVVGLAMRGSRPILEIMFGDFVTLALDQVINGVSKHVGLHAAPQPLPLVVRLPMGGRRGYGPTHSQSLEKLLVGVPNLVVVAPSEWHDPGALLQCAIEDDRPVFFIEDKSMYGRRIQRPLEGAVGPIGVRRSAGRYPSLTLSGNEFEQSAVTIATYGGMHHHAVDAMTELIVEREVFCEVVSLSSLAPLDIAPVVESVARTGRLVTCEEGTLTSGVGAEIAARSVEALDQSIRVRRVAAADRVIPASPQLEHEVLPGSADIVDAVLELLD